MRDTNASTLAPSINAAISQFAVSTLAATAAMQNKTKSKRIGGV